MTAPRGHVRITDERRIALRFTQKAGVVLRHELSLREAEGLLAELHSAVMTLRGVEKRPPRLISKTKWMRRERT